MYNLPQSADIQTYSLRANFTAIQGFQVGGDLLDTENLEEYRKDMETDVSK